VGDNDGSGFAFGLTHNLNSDAAIAYASYYYSINPLNAPLNRVPVGKVVGDHELVPRETYQNSEFFHDYSAKFGLNGSATAVLGNDNGHIACLGIVTASGTEPYSEQDLRQFQRLVPHIRRAIELNRQYATLKANCDVAHHALDQLEVGIILLDETGQVLRVNAAAEAMIKRGIGLSIRQRRLKIQHVPSNARFHELIDEAIKRYGEHGGPLALYNSDNQRPITVRVIPYLGEGYADVPNVRAIVFLKEPYLRGSDSVQQIAETYGLTGAETNFLQKLIYSSDIEAIADELQITTVTARNHMARVLAKTETNKHAELVRVVLSGRLPLLNQSQS